MKLKLSRSALTSWFGHRQPRKLRNNLKSFSTKAPLKAETDTRHYGCRRGRHTKAIIHVVPAALVLINSCWLVAAISIFTPLFKSASALLVLIPENCMWMGNTCDNFNCETWQSHADAVSSEISFDVFVISNRNLCSLSRQSDEPWLYDGSRKNPITAIEVRSHKFSAHKSQWFSTFQLNLCNVFQIQTENCLQRAGEKSKSGE